METKEQILRAARSADVWHWIKENWPVDQEVLDYFELLRKEEFEEAFGESPDLDVHYDQF